MASLNKLKKLRTVVVGAKRLWFNRVWGMDIHPTAEFSLSTHFDKTYPKGVHVAEESYVALGVMILTHDTTRRLYRDTRIERHCFIGARSLIMPGVTVGEGSIVAAGAVVVHDVPPRSIVAGNPAKVVRSDIRVGPYGRFEQ
ncbi:acyltransferase [Sphingobium sp. CCH11-B1]|jgi:acetyltransferase-like isoleucine patch superfamily enzyme|uniref:acyltransferase n=1 Tax=Sphingobium sp. CCH11-B1 TaxID=1768781 RepID=UPI00082D3DA4|nr:acyltransferase [Sphingobium sp. CCH11-B1]MEA3389275.1 acyltransferase [Pseudomonadota bacterium]